MTHAVSPPWTGIVLAGGQSSRMGRDKALLRWGGVSLLDRASDQLRLAGAARVIVCGRDAEGSGVVDVSPGQGPLSALAQLVAVLEDGNVLVVPVDMPLLSPALLGTLADTSMQCAAIEGHPLPMWLRVDAASRQVLAQLDAGPPRDRSLRRLQQALHVHLHDAAPWREQLRGCNTPEEWIALQADIACPQTDS